MTKSNIPRFTEQAMKAKNYIPGPGAYNINPSIRSTIKYRQTSKNK